MRRPDAWIAFLLVAGAGLHFLGTNVADPDLWGHLHLGKVIAQSVWSGAGFPRVDTFSYTAAGGPWIDHEWLLEVLFAALYGVAGAAGLVVLKLLIGAVMLVLLAVTARASHGALFPAQRIHPLTVALVLVAALAVIHPGATFRPQLATMLLLAVEAWLLTRADVRLTRRSERRIGWELASIPVLLALWANLHGGFVLGVAALGIYGGILVLRMLLRGFTPPGVAPVSLREACLVAAICLAGAVAPLLNPYGLELYAFLFHTLDDHAQISEWHPVELLSLHHFLRFKLFVLVTAVGIGWLATRWRENRAVVWALDWRAALLLFVAVYGFRHQRHTVLFGIVAAPLLIMAAEHARRIALRAWPALEGRPAVRAVVAAGFCAVALFQVGRWSADIAQHGLEIHFGRMDYPVDAVAFLREHELEGNVAMPFEWGEYAMWKMPESRVFIDGRFETVYPKPVIDDYFAFTDGTPGWERLIDEYPTDIVVVQRWREIHPRLFARADLTYVYSDPAALVFVRRTPATEVALDRLAQVADRHAFARPPTYFP